MVTVKVFFEGGAKPDGNTNAQTVDNTLRLRESFNKLLNSGRTNENVRIVAQPIYSIYNVVNIKNEMSAESLLLIDMDGPKSLKEKRLEDNKLKEIRDRVFFMIQRMESWILSQPEVIEEHFKDLKCNNKIIAEDNSIKNKHPEDIIHPDIILNTLLQRHFEHEKGGKVKKLKYEGGKLKIAPDLIEKLDIVKLQKTFEDVERLMKKINSI